MLIRVALTNSYTINVTSHKSRKANLYRYITSGYFSAAVREVTMTLLVNYWMGFVALALTVTTSHALRR